MKREEKIEGIKRRVRAWLLFIVIGLAVLFFGNYIDELAPGMGESVISLGFIWVGASVLFLIINLYVLWLERKKPDDEDENDEYKE